jgi:hypothetical protein
VGVVVRVGVSVSLGTVHGTLIPKPDLTTGIVIDPASLATATTGGVYPGFSTTVMPAPVV